MKKALLWIIPVLFATNLMAQTQWGLGWRKDRISFHEIKADTATITCITTDTIQVNKYYYQVEIGVVDSTMIFVSDNGDTLEISRDKSDKFALDLDLNGTRIFSLDTAAVMQLARDGDTLQFDPYHNIHVLEYEQAGTNKFWADSLGVLYLASMLGVKTAVPYHEVSTYSATPEWNLTDTAYNLRINSEAQSEDTSSVHIYTASGVPGIQGSATDGDQSDISWNTSDQMVFNGATGSYQFQTTETVLLRAFNTDASETAEFHLGQASSANASLAIGFNDASDYAYFQIYGETAGDGFVIADGGVAAFGTIVPLANSVTFGDKLTQRDILVTRENVAAGTDSALGITIASGLPQINFYATDGDVQTITNNTSDQLVFSGAVGGYSFDDDIFPSLDDTYDLGSLTLRWNDLWASDNVYIGGGAANQTATLLISHEATPANTDSSIKIYMNAGVPTISGSGTDADNSTIYWNTSDQIVVTGNSGGLITYSNIDPGATDTYTLGATAAWGSAYITDNLCVGGKAQTASIYVSQEAVFANTDSSVKVWVNSGVPTISGAGTDGDQSTITWDTADQMDFTGAVGGYTFDNDVIVSDSITTTTGFRNDAGSKLKGNVAIGRDAVGDNVIPVVTVLGDADADGTATTSETFQLTLTPNATPTLAAWAFSSTQAAGGYTFDEDIVTAGDLYVNGDDIKSDGDITITPTGDDVLLDAGLTVGSGTEAGDNNLRVEGTSLLVGEVDASDSLTVTKGIRTEGVSLLKGNVGIGRGAVADGVIPTLTILGDADADGSASTSETLTLTLTPNADPTLASWAFSNTQAVGGYTFDEGVTVATGKFIKVGAIQWDMAATDSIDGEVIGANTIDDDAIDLGDFTSADMTFDSDLVPSADGSYDLGDGAADWDSLYVEDVVVDVNLDAAGIVAAGTLTTDVAAADLELNGTTVTASGTNAAVPMTIDVKGTAGSGYLEIVDDNNAGFLAIGRTTSTGYSVLSVTDGGGDNLPGFIDLFDDGGNGDYIWFSSDHVFRTAAAIPADDDAGGYAIIDADDGTIGASAQNVNSAITTVYTRLAADASQGADIGASAVPFNLVYADSVHANWFGGSNFTLGTAGDVVTINASTLQQRVAVPQFGMTDTDINKNISTFAQSIDSSAIVLDASQTEPQIQMKGNDADAFELTINTADGAVFQNATTYNFDNAALIGTAHSVAGNLSLYGGLTTVGPKFILYNSVDEDDTQDYWVFEPNGTNFYLGVDDNDDTFIFSNAGNFTALGNVAGATYGSDASISNAELLTYDDGTITQVLVGGGAGVTPVWTEATGTGAPVRATAPTFASTIFAVSADPYFYITDTEVNLNTSTAAQILDSLAIGLDVSQLQPNIYLRGNDGDAGTISYDSSDAFVFKNAEGGLKLRTAAGGDPTVILAQPSVAHGMTTYLPNDALLWISQNSGSNGGALIRGASDGAGTTGLTFMGLIGVEDPTDAVPALSFVGGKKNGTGHTALGALETVFNVINSTTTVMKVLGNSAGVFTASASPLNGSFTVGSKGSMMTFLLTDEAVPAGTDSSKLVDISTYGDVFETNNGLVVRSGSHPSTTDGTEYTMATGVAGWGWVQAGTIGGTYATFRFTSDGAVILVGAAAGLTTADISTTNDSDAKINIYDGGTGIVIENQLNATVTVAYELHYYTP